jgi:hypothetical protein
MVAREAHDYQQNETKEGLYIEEKFLTVTQVSKKAVNLYKGGLTMARLHRSFKIEPEL